MQLARYFLRSYPGETLLMVLGLAVAAAVEGLGLTTVLPVLQMAMGGSEGGPSPLPEDNTFAVVVGDVLGSVGIEPTLGVLLTIVFVAFLLKAGILVLAKVQVGYTVAHVATDLRLGLLRHLLDARWSYYTRQPVGAVANAMATEADRASQSYYYLAQAVAFGIEAILYAGFAVLLSWRASLAAAGAAIFAVWIFGSLIRMAQRAGRSQTHLLKSLLARLTDALQTAKLLKATGRQGLMTRLLSRETEELNHQLRMRVLSQELLRALGEPVLVGLIALGVYTAVTWASMPFSSVILMVLLFWSSLYSVQKMQRRYQNAVTDSSALFSLLEMTERAAAAQEPESGATKPSLEREISFAGVSIAYGEKKVLDDASFSAPAGGITAIVGPSGAGKTTLVDLVAGLVSPDGGSIQIDGTAIEALDRTAWRRMIGYVPQEMLLLHDTIRRNVTLGDEDVSDTDVDRALRDAGAMEFVAQLEDGADTVVGERGSLLSGGQRQRIAIARALAHDPKLLILDEATAALDSESEKAVWSTVEKLKGRTTVLAISHQPGVRSVADQVFRLENGRVTLDASTTTSSAAAPPG